MAAKALKEPHELAGKQLTTGSCPECKKTVAIKANKNGIAYFFCIWPDSETGLRCNHKSSFSAKLSRKLCAAYVNGARVLHRAPPPSSPLKETYEPANDNAAPLEPATGNGEQQPEPECEPEPTAEQQPTPEPARRRGFGRRRSA